MFRAQHLAACTAMTVLFAPAAHAVRLDVGNTALTIGGYIKIDALVTNYDARPSASLEPLGRDYYAGPRSVPLSDGGDSITLLDVHAKQTRTWLRTETTLENGETLGAYVEMDFQNSAQGNETISNSYVPRMRQAYLTYGDWLVGQTWSTFQNVSALPETLDFIGPTESTVFIRQPMLRYTSGPLQFALENPETRIAGDATTDDNAIPDVALRYTLKMDSMDFVAAGLLRALESQDRGEDGVDDTIVGGGISLSGRIPFGRDDLKFMLTAGSGLGRYLGVLANFDAVVDDQGDLDAVDVLAGYVSYRHFWSDRVRSTVVYGMFSGDGDIDSASSAHVNLLYSPVRNLTLGVEFMQASRENAGGAEGDFQRLQLAAKLAF